MRSVFGLIFIVAFGLMVCSAEQGVLHKSYIIGNTQHTITPKSQEFVQALSAEIFQKTGIKAYLDIIDTITTPSIYSTKQARKLHQQEVLRSLKNPCVVIFLFLQERKIELVSSDDLHYFLDEKKLESIYFDYMAPLLPEKEQDITPQRISAVILNGYSELADVIGHQYNIVFENNFETNEEGVRTFVRFIMYAMLIILLGLFFLAHFSRKKNTI